MKSGHSIMKWRMLITIPSITIILLYGACLLRNLNSPNASFSPDKRWMIALQAPITLWGETVDVYYQPSWLPFLLTEHRWFEGSTSKAEPHHFSWQDNPFVVSVWRDGQPIVVLDRKTGRNASLATYWRLVAPPQENIHVDMLEHLINKGFSVQDFLFAAIEARDLDAVKRLVEHYGADVNQISLAPIAAIPLGWAASIGDYDIVSYLLNHGASVNCSDPRPFPPICSAGGNTNIIMLLLNAGADINTQGGQGRWSALHVAASNGDSDAARFLVQRGIDVSLRGSDGTTAQEVAEEFAKSNQPEPFRHAYEEVARYLRTVSTARK